MNHVNVSLSPVRYALGHPPDLPHQRRSVLEWLCSLVMQSHVCQICRRKELWSVSGWLQVDDPAYQDADGCSVVCLECARRNPAIFGAI